MEILALTVGGLVGIAVGFVLTAKAHRNLMSDDMNRISAMEVFGWTVAQSNGRWANPESAEYQALFPDTLSGLALVNAFLCHQAIRKLVVDYEQKAAARSQEKLIYRHALHVITAVMMKRLRERIGATAVIDPASIPALISQPLDQLRQQTFDLGQQRLLGEGPLAYFRNQSNVATFLADLMETHFVLATDPAIAQIRNIQNAADAYPRKRLLDYLSSRAPQL